MMKRPLCALLLAVSNVPVSAATPAFGVTGASGQASATQGDTVVSLRAADAVEAGSRIRTGVDGRVDLRLEPVGAVTLGNDTDLTIHSIESVNPPARMHLARLVIERGAARISSRTSMSVPADLRVNLGGLRLRIFGADVWAERAKTYDEVCLLGGAIEVQSPAGAQRLDSRGDCLRLTTTGLQYLQGAATGPFAPRMLEFAEARAPSAFETSASSAPAEPSAQTEPASITAAAVIPEPVTPAVAETPDAIEAWTIVLASFPERATAESEAERLRTTGIDAAVAAAQRKDGSTTWRIVSGRYASKADAIGDLREIRGRRGLASAWLAAPP